MTVNRSAMFCTRFGKAPCLSIAPLIEKFSDNVTLELTVLVLYHISIENSFFRPYLNSLPKVFSVPAYWDMSIFKAFNGSLTMKRAIGSLKSR